VNNARSETKSAWNRDVHFAPAALRVSAGVIVWAVHFAVVYGFTGLACARRFDEGGAIWVALVPWVIGAASLLAALMILALILPLVRAVRRAQFIDWMSGCVAALALAAIVLETIPLLWVPVCG
jgi:hypothetical protein